jgi:hypothetical protein
MKEPDYFDVYGIAVTNSAVSFVSRIERIPGESKEDAALKAVEQAVTHGLQCTLMIGVPPLPVRPVSFVPFRVEPSPAKVTVAHTLPRENLQ